MRLTVLLHALLLVGTALFAQKYNGPVPEKEDLPYIVQADNLIPTEAKTAQEDKGKKGETTYFVAGAASKARTPLASPAFVIKVKDLVPETLQLFRLEVKNGRREITFRSGKNARNPQPVRVDIKRLGEGLVQLEVGESLPAGEYSLTPEGSNDVFCFEVF